MILHTEIFDYIGIKATIRFALLIYTFFIDYELPKMINPEQFQ